jgi:undecaprenyl diphosphate synthase
MPTLHRAPRHLGIIPDGNRRWAERQGLSKAAGYEAGIEPALRLLPLCRELGIEEVSAYGFTKENVRRPGDQVASFRSACVEFAQRACAAGAGLLVVGDAKSPAFPEALRPFVGVRAPGTPRLNLLVNYGWRWDVRSGMSRARRERGKLAPLSSLLASRDVSRVDLVVRWGGRRRLSGFLPLQCAYADIAVVDTLWPDMRVEELIQALAWYGQQDVTLGG